MTTERSTKAEEFRRKAREYADIARRMSLDHHRHEMEQIARRWSDLADRLDPHADGDEGSQR